jgi:NAD(P)-dependent dehydrogenase (short-subunit alcohol dehydrogenase family)
LKEAVDKIGSCDILINNVGIYPMQRPGRKERE